LTVFKPVYFAVSVEDLQGPAAPSLQHALPSILGHLPSVLQACFSHFASPDLQHAGEPCSLLHVAALFSALCLHAAGQHGPFGLSLLSSVVCLQGSFVLVPALTKDITTTAAISKLPIVNSILFIK
jgi:hypothetical protein